MLTRKTDALSTPATVGAAARSPTTVTSTASEHGA
jgi:hypothetical protein